MTKTSKISLKKFMSVLLATLILVSCMSQGLTSFATTSEFGDGYSLQGEISVDETVTAEVSRGVITLFKFVPTISGTYQFYSDSYEDTYGFIYNAELNQLDYDDDGGEETNFSITYDLTAGETYYFGASYYDNNSGSYSVTLVCLAADCDHPTTTSYPAIPVDCYENGYTAGEKCDVCKAWASGHEVILAYHISGSFVETIEPTCYEDGYDRYYCSNCDEYYEENWVESLGHEGTFIKTVEPTCYEYGYDWYYCSNCDGYYEENWVDPLGHTGGTFVETVDPTCEDGGYDVYENCTRCGGEYYENWIGSLGHSEGSLIKTVEPTCINGGYDVYSCGRCEELYHDNWTDPLDDEHEYTLIETVEPNCHGFGGDVVGYDAGYGDVGGVGYDVYYCSICDDAYIDNFVNPSFEEHSITATEVAATCVDPSHIEYYCSECDYRYMTYFGDSAIGHSFSNDVCSTCGIHKNDCVESEHSYADFTDETWTISKPGAKKIAITFAAQTYVEFEYDFIYIYDSNDNLLGVYTGDTLAGKRLEFAADTVKIRLKTDYSVTYYGFAVTKVEAVYGGENYTGLFNVNGTWRYIKNGAIDNTFTGLCKYNNAWYYVKDGVLDWSKTGLVKHTNGVWYYVENGKINFNKTGVVKHTNNVWYYVEGGQIKWSKTGVIKSESGSWLYIKGGQVDFSKNGLVKSDSGSWLYIKNGRVDFSKTGLVKHTNGVWYYVQNGRINFAKTGLVKHTNGVWYYVQGGQINFSKTGLVKHTNGVWYYVQGGQIKWSKTGLVKHTDGNLYYVKNGQINWKYTGDATYNGKTYKVVNGKV